MAGWAQLRHGWHWWGVTVVIGCAWVGFGRAANEPPVRSTWQPVSLVSPQDSVHQATRRQVSALTQTFAMMAYEAEHERRVRGIAAVVAGVGSAAIVEVSNSEPRLWLLASAGVMTVSGLVSLWQPTSPEERLWSAWRDLPEQTADEATTKLHEGQARFAQAAQRQHARRMMEGWASVVLAPLALVMIDNRTRATLATAIAAGAGIWRLIQPTRLEQQWRRYQFAEAGTWLLDDRRR